MKWISWADHNEFERCGCFGLQLACMFPDVGDGNCSQWGRGVGFFSGEVFSVLFRVCVNILRVEARHFWKSSKTCHLASYMITVDHLLEIEIFIPCEVLQEMLLKCSLWRQTSQQNKLSNFFFFCWLVKNKLKTTPLALQPCMYERTHTPNRWGQLRELPQLENTALLLPHSPIHLRCHRTQAMCF